MFDYEQRFYTWDHIKYCEGDIRKVFESRLSIIISSKFYEYRVGDGRWPVYVPEELKSRIQARWDTDPKFKKRSANGKKNSENHYKHYCGSMSMPRAKDMLTDKNVGEEPSLVEIVKFAMTPKTGPNKGVCPDDVLKGTADVEERAAKLLEQNPEKANLPKNVVLAAVWERNSCSSARGPLKGLGSVGSQYTSTGEVSSLRMSTGASQFGGGTVEDVVSEVVTQMSQRWEQEKTEQRKKMEKEKRKREKEKKNQQKMFQYQSDLMRSFILSQQPSIRLPEPPTLSESEDDAADDETDDDSISLGQDG